MAVAGSELNLKPQAMSCSMFHGSGTAQSSSCGNGVVAK